jgi:hypothetical protein
MGFHESHGTVRAEFEGTSVHEIRFDGSNLPSGIHFCRLQTGRFISVTKMTLLK